MSPRGSKKGGRQPKPEQERFWQMFDRVPKKLHPGTKKVSASWCRENLGRAKDAETRQKIIDVILKWKFLTPKQFQEQVIPQLERILEKKGY